MSNKITTYADVEIVGTLTKARDNGVARVIEQQLLDGTFNVQTIGIAATKIDVEFYCTIAVRRVLQGYANTAELIKVWWDDKIWTGHIAGGQIKWNWFTDQENDVSFDLLVVEEEEQ